MKMVYLILVIVIALGLLFVIKCRAREISWGESIAQQPQDTTSKINPKENPYSGLRDMALDATRAQLGIKDSPEDYKVFGIVMDWGVDHGTATLTAFLSGDASLYLSSGGGIIGGFAHENVKQSALTFLRQAQKYFNMTSKVRSTPLPIKDEVKFYFLTDDGKFVVTEAIQNIKSNSSSWGELFNEANKVITELRLLTPNN
jgi:hypothetical protein